MTGACVRLQRSTTVVQNTIPRGRVQLEALIGDDLQQLWKQDDDLVNSFHNDIAQQRVCLSQHLPMLRHLGNH